MIIDSCASDIIYTAAISGVAANFLKPSLEAIGINSEMLEKNKKINFGNDLSMMEKEIKAWSTIWSAGQGVSSIEDNISIELLVSNMKKELKEVIEEQQLLLKKYF